MIRISTFFKNIALVAFAFSFVNVSTNFASGQATPSDSLRLPEGFSAELLYSVPTEQGSWVSLTTDPKGRLIASDQYGKLYRITPGKDGPTSVETIDLSIGTAQGLLCAFDSLYVVSFGIDKKPAGLYRVRDTDNDDKYDSVELLRKINGGTEHGPHAVILSPDKKSLYICAGNHTQIPDPETSRVPMIWQEDQILTRFPDAGGHAAGRMAPGGWVCKTDPDGKSFELVSSGFRNQYDIAFDPNGELFTYDADMEWDVGLPWYRPTRVCHVVSGSEFGWRHGSGKWPETYPDSVPPVINIGPGSPTGIVFGTGAKFPAEYQNALFISDWSYGMIYAVRLEPNGSSFSATKEKFCSASALPVTDLVINQTDGAMYFLIGGRRSQSGLYRVTYNGDASTAAATYPAADPATEVRRKLESYHLPGTEIDWDFVWEKLGDSDRFIRYAARTALEHQNSGLVEKKTFENYDKSNNQQRLESLLAVIRMPRASNEDNTGEIVSLLMKLNWEELSQPQRIHMVRTLGLVICRLGHPPEKKAAANENPKKAKSVINSLPDFMSARIKKLDAHFPTNDDKLDREMAKLLIAIGSEPTTEKVVNLLTSPSAQEPQIAYAMMLSDAKVGWSQKLREQYFQWFLDSERSKGGNSFGGYIQNVRKYAIEGLAKNEKAPLAELLARKAESKDPYADLKARSVVKNWKMEDLIPLEDAAFEDRDLANGKKMFALASCYRCHRLEGQGGIVGPDLTPAGHRFNTKDLLETIIDPSKEISDQYQATIFQMEDGKMITGRVANLNGKRYMIQEDMIDPGKFTNIQVDQIEEMKPSKISMMPAGLLDTLSKDDILDLMAYLKSVGKQAANKE